MGIMLSPLNNKSAQASPGLIKFNAPAAVLDIETTGLKASDGDRIVEIAVLVISGSKAGEVWQRYINPEMTMPKVASDIHGLTDDKLYDKPLFRNIASSFLSFIDSLGSNCQLVAHNGRGFDFPFLNSELRKAKYPPIDKKKWIDSLDLARYLYPGQANNLDALCRRLNINISERTLHGALLDCQLLGQAYLKMSRSVEDSLHLDTPKEEITSTFTATKREHLRRPANKEEQEKHDILINSLHPETKAIWNKNNDNQ